MSSLPLIVICALLVAAGRTSPEVPTREFAAASAPVGLAELRGTLESIVGNDLRHDLLAVSRRPFVGRFCERAAHSWRSAEVNFNCLMAKPVSNFSAATNRDAVIRL
ncbi:MAG: hypothetical protein JWP89_4941 [Schlesneria sp.]|nr:hypothetical protein [Schlesneria sp.]